MTNELWDARDQDGNLLGFDIPRGGPVIENVWHYVVDILPVTTDRRVLITRRHPAKPWGGFWEYTAGSVLKGEAPVDGALRELREETGITVPAEALYPVSVYPHPGLDGWRNIYYSYITFFDPARQPVRLQSTETTAYKLIPYEDFKQFLKTPEFARPIAERFQKHEQIYDEIIAKHNR